MMSRAGIFRASEGIAIEMTNRVFKLPSFHGTLYFMVSTSPNFFIAEIKTLLLVFLNFRQVFKIDIF